MEFTEIQITTASAHGDGVSAFLSELGLGFQEVDESTLDAAPRGQVRFHLFVPPGEEPEVLRALREELALPEGAIVTQRRDEDEWRDSWKRFFSVRRVGRFAIVPSWELDQAGAEALPIYMDPGRAFGTGGHASTRLCLRLLCELAAAFAAPRVLDVGCGCGVLALGALRLWPEAPAALAIDIDAEAVETTEENAGRNGMEGRLRASTTPLEQVPGVFEVVFGNLTGPTLLELADALAARVAPGGALILSGILQTEAAQVAARFEGLGLRLQAREEEEEWAGLLMRRP